MPAQHAGEPARLRVLDAREHVLELLLAHALEREQRRAVLAEPEDVREAPERDGLDGTASLIPSRLCRSPESVFFSRLRRPRARPAPMSAEPEGSAVDRIWSIVCSPSPSMSIWFRPTNQTSFSRSCAGHSGFTQRRAVSLSASKVVRGEYTLPSAVSISTASRRRGHAGRRIDPLRAFGRSFSTGSTTYGMISPAFSTSTVSPTRMSFLRDQPEVVQRSRAARSSPRAARAPSPPSA
jgi:hypothetical protein